MCWLEWRDHISSKRLKLLVIQVCWTGLPSKKKPSIALFFHQDVVQARLLCITKDDDDSNFAVYLGGSLDLYPVWCFFVFTEVFWVNYNDHPAEVTLNCGLVEGILPKMAETLRLRIYSKLPRLLKPQKMGSIKN